ncbi:SET domain-containing protein-lysine N-methyltransferase [Candidatus Parcubacteria bacterium]|nr:SET domain-containing protein-lysine N-methyltransferase [Candidatus Parcubacteria bacterium]
MSKDLIVKKSKIAGKGIFANKDFKKGEVVMKWQISKELSRREVEKLPLEEKHYIYPSGKNKYILMQAPERYANHSCEANTIPGDNCDIALRNIKRGEELTSNYTKYENKVGFRCNCGSKNCTKKIIS